jgi:hypothetical protein
MRRAALAVVVGLLGGTARAEPWTVTGEAGAEADSNVTRTETMPGSRPLAAAVGRSGARLDGRGALAGGSYALGLSGLARIVPTRDDHKQRENVALLTADGRWLHAVGGPPLTVGAGVNVADALSFIGGTGARTFRNLGADALVGLGSDAHHLLLAVGARDFVYKENHDYDWRGPTASARLDAVLWQPEGGTHSLDLSVTLGFEHRAYFANAFTDSCKFDEREDCNTGTRLLRRDRFQRAGFELDWTGDIVATAGYQLIAIDSNSYTQSLVRHRVLASATTELLDKLFVTATAILQIEQYPDGIQVLSSSAINQELTNLEDESRSSLQVRIARELSRAWSLEARGAIWRNLGNADTGTFRRELLYAGVIYSR